MSEEQTQTQTTEQNSLLGTPPKDGTTPQGQSEPPEQEESKVEETKKEEPKKEEAAAPLTAESIKLPEGVEVDQPTMEKFLGLMNDKDMSPQDRAQALVDLQVEAVKQASEKGSELWQTTQEQWQSEVKSAEDIGGPRYEATIANCGKLISQYGTPELRDIFTLTGAGNNIHMVRFLNNIANVLNEGGMLSANPTQVEGRSAAEVLYPNQGKG